MTGIAPTPREANHLSVLGESNYHISLYIASLMNIPQSIPTSTGQDVFVILHFADRLNAARALAQLYLDHVAAPLRVMARSQIPACNQTFGAFVRVADAVPPNQPMRPETKLSLLVSLKTFADNVHVMQTSFTAIHASFRTFQSGVPADAEALHQLSIAIGPDGSVSSQAGISEPDRQVVQATVESSAPNLSQDAGLAVTASGQMDLSLVELADSFAAMDQQVATLNEDLDDTNASVLAGKLDLLSLHAAEADWRQFAAFVAQIGF